VWKSRQSTMPIGRPDPIVVAIPAGQLARLKTEVARPDPLVAPFQRGQTVAQLKLTLGDQPLPDIPLFSLQQIEQAGVIGRAWDAVRLWIK
jgi:D-alanyl-D-alanine carboxypeptidase (penicillin-binding protein 5/6)